MVGFVPDFDGVEVIVDDAEDEDRIVVSVVQPNSKYIRKHKL